MKIALPQRSSLKKAGWLVAALIVANEIRGIIVVAAIGWPLLKAMWQ